MAPVFTRPLSLLVAFVAVVVFSVASSWTARAFACSGSSPCYAIGITSPPDDSVGAEIFYCTSALSAPSGDFANNEMWLTMVGGTYYTEAGVNYGDAGYPRLFWADETSVAGYTNHFGPETTLGDVVADQIGVSTGTHWA